MSRLFDLGWRIFAKIMGVVDPGGNADWDRISLSPAQQEGLDQSRALFLEAAAQGHLDAQAMCGDMYRIGRGVPKDDRLAFVYHEKAAHQGRSRSQFLLGMLYHEGRGCEESGERAAEWLEKAVLQGHPIAMVLLGILYHNGKGVPQSFTRAFQLYQQSRDVGNTHPVLHSNLGLCYEAGHGVDKDYLEARRFYKLASAQGMALATDGVIRVDEKIRTECPLLGKRVVITGTSQRDLNGRVGNATSFDHEQDRYVVELDNDTDATQGTGNLRLNKA